MDFWSSTSTPGGPRLPTTFPTVVARRWLRISFIIALVILLVCGCPPRTDRRQIVVLCSSLAFEPILRGLKEQMERLGYREDVHVAYDFQHVQLPSNIPQLVQSLKEKKTDLIFAFPTEAAMAAKEAARQIHGLPVVFAYAGIEGSGLVASVRAPGGNVTGIRFPGPEQIGKRLEILRTIAPQVQRVWIGYNQHYPNTAPALAVLRPLADLMGIDLEEVPVETLEELAADLDRRARTGDPGMDAMLLMPDTYNHSPEGWRLISGFAKKHNLPIAGSFLYTVEDGAVFGNANDLAEIGELAAPLVAKIFDGIPAGTIPVVTPEQDLYINYKRARELGLHLPEGYLRQAKVIIR